MRIVLILFFSLSIFALQAQLVNQGGTITVKSGASLVVQSDITNSSGSIVLESGATLDVSGDFTNAATMNFNAASQTIFSGTANSDVTSGGGVFGNLQVDKTSANVVLLDAMTINGQLDFAGSNNKVVLGNYDLTMGSGSGITNYESTKYVQADGSGLLIRKLASTGTKVFPVGDGSNYSPLTANVTAGTFAANAALSVNLTDAFHPSKYTDATEYITRYWHVGNSDITGFAATLSGTYADVDVTGSDESLIYGTYWDGTEWVYTNSTSNPAGNTIGVDVGDDAVVYLFGQNKFGKVNVKAFLAGNYNSSSGLMSTTLNSSNLIPLNSPYTDAPASVLSIPVNVTDWIKIEMRDASNPSVVLEKVSAFLKNNGDIVGLDGTSLPNLKNAPSTGFISLHHRNHLAIRTSSAIDLYDGILFNFSTAQSQAYQNPANSTNPAMRFISGTNTAYCMYGGNANGNTNVRYTGLNNDKATLLTALGGNTATVVNNAYNNADLNLNGVIRYTGLNNDKAVLLNNLDGNTASVYNQHL